MEYMIMIHRDERAWMECPEADRQQLVVEHREFAAALREAGVPLTWSSAVALSTTASVLRATDAGEVAISDGPFTGATAQLAGVYVIDVNSHDEAINWARRVPVAPGIHTVELRPTQ